MSFFKKFFLVSFVLFINTGLFAQDNPTLSFDFDECNSFISGSNGTYSEFTADYLPQTNCTRLVLSGDNLYRRDEQRNTHSCTPGLNDTRAMCVSSNNTCAYDQGNDRSVVIDIIAMPGLSGFGSIDKFSFYELAPENFEWLDGDSGVNNYPTKYGLRVLKNGEMIYREAGIPTSQEWSLESFDFSDNGDFTFTEETTFTFELLAYCLIGVPARANAWDLEDLVIEGGCSEFFCPDNLDGGILAGGAFDFCVGDGIADNIPDGAITLDGNVGSNNQWVVTDESGTTILGLPANYSDVDFDGAGTGTCLIWNLSYEDELVGLEAQGLVANLMGCFSLSNSITVNRNQPIGGTLTGGPFEFCVGDGMADMIGSDEISLSGNAGANSQWVVTDDQGNILGLPGNFSDVDFDGAGAGTCLVWHLSYDGDLTGAEVGMNASDLGGCFSLSNSITVVRNQPVGGTISGGPFEFCVGDGESDMIGSDEISLSGNAGANSQWVVTDDQGNILGLPGSFSDVDFDGAEAGTCLVWHLSFDGDLTGAEMGMNASDLGGCFSLSNSITVNRLSGDDCPNSCVVDGGTLSGGPFEFCVGDGTADMIGFDAITLSGNVGGNSQWVVTDEQGMILGLPGNFSDVDFDGAGSGTCLVWHLSYDGDLTGAEVGLNANNIEGCYGLSNSISVVRNQPIGGTISGGPFEFCVGDGIADMIGSDAISLSGNAGANSQWVITDDQGNILGLPGSFSDVDFDGADAGTCLVWHLSYDGDLTGAEMGMNASDLDGCFSLSNSISVVRNQPSGGILTGGPFEFCVGDGVRDTIALDGITLTDNIGSNNQWVVTDEQGMILGLPGSFSDVDFDGAGAGTCLVWHLSYDGDLTGAEMGMNASDLGGCYSLSNSISVVRNQPIGGTLSGGPFEFCVADGVLDTIAIDSITLTGNIGTNSQWVITNEQGEILGLPATFSAVNFDETGAGTCLVWHLSFNGELTGAEVGMNANDLEGCYSLSNSISVVRLSGGDCISDCTVAGGGLSGGPFEFCVGDGVEDTIATDGIVLVGNVGANSQWVVTDDQGIILGLPGTFSAVDFDEAGAGTCLVWHLSYDGELSGAEVGMNANDIGGCFSLSNSISVVRNNPVSGTLTGGPFEFCVGDGVSDTIALDGITLSGNSGANSQWVVTDDQGVILGLPDNYNNVDFDEAGAGTCLIWHLSYDGELTGAEIGMNPSALGGCFDLSNSITVNRVTGDDCPSDCSVVGGTLTGGPFEFCVGDGVKDTIATDGITLTGNMGANSQWVVTDDQGIILGLPGTFSAVDFDEAGAGTCLVWHMSYDGDLTGAEVGMNANDIGGCLSLSNSISVVRLSGDDCPSECAVVGGTLTGGPFEFCVGDGVRDTIATDGITLTGNMGANSQWVVTDDQGIILGLPGTFSAVDFDEADAGTCLVWHLSYDGELTGAEVGMNANDIGGCLSLSNSISVVRNQPIGGTLTGGPFEFCVGDGMRDTIATDGITLTGNMGANSQWVVTDDQGIILGLPGTFSAVDFDGAGAGTCLVWHLSYDGDLTGAEVGMNANDLGGCFNLSNSITVNRVTGDDCPSDCSVVGGTLTGGPFEFCVGDGMRDTIATDGITLTGNTGANSQWVVTDDQGIILGLPGTFSAVDFDEAGAGTCLVWHLSYDGDISGAEVGMNANDIGGCLSLSNSITVVRLSGDDCPSDCAAVGGTITGGPFEFCVGDGVKDTIAVDGITLTGNAGANSQWVVTDDQGIILGLPGTFSDVDFDEAGAGTCLVWHLSYDGELTGAEVGMNANDIGGCFSLSNSISVVRKQPIGGTLTGGPFEFCVGDGVSDTIAVDGITLSGNVGANSQWVVTDDQGNILGLPGNFSDVDFDGAGAGTCLVWHLSFDGDLTGAEVGMNANDIGGCFSLSNSISVVRLSGDDCPSDCSVVGGTLTGGPFEFCVGDGMRDTIATDGITLTGNVGANSQWVVTDDQGIILGLPGTFSAVDFDEAGAGTCLVWHLSYDGDISGAEVGMNANDIGGCLSLSNSISVVRNQPSGGTLTGGPFEFCVGDGVADTIATNEITLIDNGGANSQWVITDDLGEILGLPGTFSAVDFDEAGVGTCLVWHLSYDGDISGAEVGMNANDIQGCLSLSNSISVNRVENGPACQAVCNVGGGIIAGGPFEFCVGDGVADTIATSDITLDQNTGENSQWVVTDDQGVILGLPGTFSAVDFDGAGAGTCLVWHLSFDGDLTGAEVGMNANDIAGCFSLSNSIVVRRNQPFGGNLNGGPFTFCVGDEERDTIATSSITLFDNSGTNSQWIVTDGTGTTILGLPDHPSQVDFDESGVGTCLVWHLSYEGDISGLEENAPVSGISGCFNLSNSIEVNRVTGDDCPELIGIAVINEINANGNVEIKNIGTAQMDVGRLVLCQFPAYEELRALTVVCGDFVLDPNEIVTVATNNITISESDGELALYTLSAFSDPNAIIDYVEWGSTDHMRSSVAVSAGIWTTGDVVSAWSTTNSLIYDGSGDNSSDWSEDNSSFCMDNFTSETPTMNFVISPNPFVDNVNIRFDENIDGMAKVWIIDSFGAIQHETQREMNRSNQMNISLGDLMQGTYFLRVISENKTYTQRFIKVQ